MHYHIFFFQYAYVGVVKNATVEVIANEQGNRGTPCYVSFSAKERAVGEAAYNQQHFNIANTIYHASKSTHLQLNDQTLYKY